MITTGGAGPSFMALPPKRLKPKSPLSMRPSNSRPPLPAQRSPQQQPSSSASSSSNSTSTKTETDPAWLIESLVNSRSRLSVNYGRNSSSAGRAPSLTGIGEDEWARSFAEDDAFLSSFSDPATSEIPPPEGSPHSVSFYTPASSGSSTTSTVRLSMEESQTPASQSPSRKLQRRRPSQPPISISPRASIDETSAPASPGLKARPDWQMDAYGRGDRGNMSTPSASIRDIYIAVIGASGVGKSTFIRQAYDLKRDPRKGELPTISITVEKCPCHIKLVEINWSKIDFTKHPPQWPRMVDVPFIDGVAVLYDVTNPASISRVPESLDALSKAQIPVCLVSTKCDASKRQLNPHNIEQIGIVGGYEQIQTSVMARDSQKQVVAAIVSNISRKNDKTFWNLNGRRRANSSAANSRAASPRPTTAGHHRASSEFSTSFLKEGNDGVGTAHGNRIPRTSGGQALGTLALHSTPATGGSRSKHGGFNPPHPEVVSVSPFSMQQSHGTSSQSSLPSHVSSGRDRRSLVETDDDSLGFYDPDDVPILERDGDLDSLSLSDQQVPPNKGWTLDELIDRLLAQPLGKADHTFITTFLLLFRRFATPNQLLAGIIQRFDRVESGDDLPLNKLPTLLRYCGVLHQWVTTHPGDVARANPKSKLTSFLRRISTHRALAILASEMMQAISNDIEDEDEEWAKPDPDSPKGDVTLQEALALPIATEKRMAGAAHSNQQPTLRVPKPAADLTRRTSEVSYDSVSSSSSSLGYVSVQPHIENRRSLYETFMLLTVDEVAIELTRIDWVDFGRVSPREILRHQSLPADVREKSANLRNINGMIRRFNYVAHWVAVVILEKSKPKHRARALEKFMEVAWSLRHRNNYNSLGAIIAGINGIAIHRLSMTRELVRPEVAKNFMRLELLMSTHKGHTKYRLAWENTSTERIPFIPVHRRDLVSADEGNKTYLNDDRINWNKFQVMGEILLNVSRAQEHPHKYLKGNAAVDRSIQEAVENGVNDDELYERSVQLENASNVAPGRSRRNWFLRQ